MSNHMRQRGIAHRNRILTLIAGQPTSAQMIADKMGMERPTILWHLRLLMEEQPRRLHIADYQRTESRPAPMYMAGNLPDVEFEPMRKPKLPDRVTARLDAIRALLKKKPHTAKQLAALVFIEVSGLNRHLRTLRANKETYIKGWEHPGRRGDWAPIHAYGTAPDAPKPAPTRAERYRTEVKDPEKRDRQLSKRRALHRITAAKKKQQTAFSALGL